MATMTHKSGGAMLAATEFAAQVLQAYMECNDEVQKVVRDMLNIMTSDTVDEDDREAARLTFYEALFPEGPHADPGLDFSEAFDGVEHSPAAEKHRAEEATFAERLANVMKVKGITQAALAERSGVRQPAISMMLARNCRPQRATVAKLAKALAVSSQDLWPTSK